MGFKDEGRLRENVFFDKAFHDTVVLGLLKSEYERRDQETWLKEVRRDV